MARPFPYRAWPAVALLALGSCASPIQAPEGLDLRLVLEGGDSYSERELLSEMALDFKNFERRSSSKAVIDDAAFSLESFYRSEGFPFCLVEYEIDDSGPGVLAATFEIQEGPRTRVTGVRLSAADGELEYPEQDLARFLPVSDARFLKEDRTWYVAREVSSASEAMATYYFEQGYRDVRVSEPQLTWSEGRETVGLAFVVDEGARYRLEAVRVEGTQAKQGLRAELERLRGQPYSPEMRRILLGRLLESLGVQGHADARVTASEEVSAERARVTLVLQAVPGPVVTISGIRIEGNEHTDAKRIRGALELAAGERYDVRKERESLRNLYQLGLFSALRLSLEGEGERRELVLQVEESPSIEVFFEPGYGSYEQLRAGAGVREKNLFGSARVLDFEGTVSSLSQHGELSLSDPRFLDTDLEASTSLFTTRRIEPSFTSEELGGALRLRRRFTREFSVSVAYQYRRSLVGNTDISIPGANDPVEDVDISSILLSPSYDSRDNVFVPHTGTLSRLSLEFGDAFLGSELDFLRLQSVQSRFFELDAGTVLGLSWRGGVIIPTSSDEGIPLQERFFNGGQNSVRSFEQNELGPIDSLGNELGGEAFNVVSVELRQRLRGRFEGALFWDAGNLEPDFESYFRITDVRHALGFGLRYLLPVGPVRFDVGFNPDPRSGESDVVTHFSVGMSF